MTQEVSRFYEAGDRCGSFGIEQEFCELGHELWIAAYPSQILASVWNELVFKGLELRRAINFCEMAAK
ncbi:hypothetical protein G9P44_003972 [Scheffersomyces stipitis]|nr:hypothetical protein G9P44_003972 [Scheffersomyces stipitis]